MELNYHEYKAPWPYNIGQRLGVIIRKGSGWGEGQAMLLPTEIGLSIEI